MAQGVELPSYLPLYSPAMGWIFQCVSYHAPEVRPVGVGGRSPLGSKAGFRPHSVAPLLRVSCNSPSIRPTASVMACQLCFWSAQPYGWFSADCLSRLYHFLDWEERSHSERPHSCGWKLVAREKPLKSFSRTREALTSSFPVLCPSAFLPVQ